MENNSPKRRKSKDNPYVINHNEINNTYIVVFNCNNKKEQVKVSKEVYDAFNEFELTDLKQMNEVDRHYDLNEITDEYVYHKSNFKQTSVEDIVEKKIMSEKLRDAINLLPLVQKRRLKMYFFENMSMMDIAKQEGCSKVAVKHNIDDAIANLKKILKK